MFVTSANISVRRTVLIRVLVYLTLVAAVVFPVAACGASTPNSASGNTSYSQPSYLYAAMDKNIYALDPNSGTLKWLFQMVQVASGTPRASNGVLYATDVGGDVYAIQASNGKEIWHTTTSGQPNQNVDTTPVIANGVVYIGSLDGKIYALDAHSGSKMWSFSTQGEIWQPPIYAANTIFVAPHYDNTLYALDAHTGAVKWKLSKPNCCEYGYLATDGRTVFITGSGVTALNIKNGSQLWQNPIGVSPDVNNSDVLSPATVVHGSIFLYDFENIAYSFNTTTGSENWQRTPPYFQCGSAAVGNRPTIQSDALYFTASSCSQTVAVNISTGSVVWQRNIGYFMSPVGFNNAIVVSDSSGVYALSPRTGDTLWSKQLPGTNLNQFPAFIGD